MRARLRRRAARGRDAADIESPRRLRRRQRGARARRCSTATRSNCATASWRLLERLPGVDPRALHALGDRLYGTDPARARTLSSTRSTPGSPRAWRPAQRARGALVRLAEVWEKVNAAARDVEEYNLERKPLVFNVFGWLAEASRG